MIRFSRIGGIAAALLLALPLVARAQLHAYGAASADAKFVVIVNVANPVSTLNRAEVSKLFLRKRSKWENGGTVEPVDLLQTSPVRRTFSNEIHHMGVLNVKSYWQEEVFSGRAGSPAERATEADVVAFVKANPNAVGYVGAATAADGVKVINLAP